MLDWKTLRQSYALQGQKREQCLKRAVQDKPAPKVAVYDQDLLFFPFQQIIN